MKRILVYILSAVFITSMFITPASAKSLIDKYIDQNNYTLLGETEDGYAIIQQSGGAIIHMTDDGWMPNSFHVTTKTIVDIAPYVNGEKTDFYGVEIVSIKKLYRDDMLETLADRGWPYFDYSIITAEDYTKEEGNKLFENIEDIYSYSMSSYGGESPDEETILGDVDGSGVVDSMDYIILKRVYFGTYGNLINNSNADVNQNGEIDSLDYILVKRMYFGTWSPEDASYDETVSYPIEYPAD